MIKLLIGGSPCTRWSVARTKDREVTASGIGWELFCNYRIAKERFNPDFFLYENNASASTEIKEQISADLGVQLEHINSGLLSAQSRERFYAFNWETPPPPQTNSLFLRIYYSLRRMYQPNIGIQIRHTRFLTEIRRCAP